MSGMMPILRALLNFFDFSLSELDEISFWINIPKRIMTPIAANEPAMVIVDTVEVVTVEIMGHLPIIWIKFSIRYVFQTVNK